MVQRLDEHRFRVKGPTKIKYVGREMYFDDFFEFVFQRDEDGGTWLVVEMD